MVISEVHYALAYNIQKSSAHGSVREISEFEEHVGSKDTIASSGLQQK